VNQPNGGVVPDTAVAWNQERSAGGLHDVYVRFLTIFGAPKGPPVLVNTATLDAATPALAADGNGNVFVAWEEYDSDPAKLSRNILMRKYTLNGAPVGTPVQVNVVPSPIPTPPAPVPQAHAVALAINASGQVVATWWEAKSVGSEPETVFYRRFDNSLVALDSAQVQVDQPPSAPAGVNRAATSSIAIDPNGNFVVAWDANVNAADASSWSAMAKTFSAAGAVQRNDFRVDLAGRSSAAPPRVALSAQAKKFAYAWRDNRTGHDDVYTRVVPSLP
jgi:hypothetical protein